MNYSSAFMWKIHLVGYLQQSNVIEMEIIGFQDVIVIRKRKDIILQEINKKGFQTITHKYITKQLSNCARKFDIKAFTLDVCSVVCSP